MPHIAYVPLLRPHLEVIPLAIGACPPPHFHMPSWSRIVPSAQVPSLTSPDLCVVPTGHATAFVYMLCCCVFSHVLSSSTAFAAPPCGLPYYFRPFPSPFLGRLMLGTDRSVFGHCFTLQRVFIIRRSRLPHGSPVPFSVKVPIGKHTAPSDLPVCVGKVGWWHAESDPEVFPGIRGMSKAHIRPVCYSFLICNNGILESIWN